MSNMQERFKRAYLVLENESKTWDESTFKEVVKGDNLNLMWLRNEANLWLDWDEDKDWLIDGVHYDPNHPDNLSYAVYKLWQSVKQNVGSITRDLPHNTSHKTNGRFNVTRII